MSHPQNTPEYRLARSDSKNPATTCWGIKADGQKCRRTVVSAKSSPSSPSPPTGVVLGNSEIGNTTTALFCWQHKGQAARVTTPSAKPPKPASKLKLRSSIETLVERVGLLDVNDRERPASAWMASERPFAPRKEIEGFDSQLQLDGHNFQRRGTRRHSINTPGRHVFQTENAPLSSPKSSSKSSVGRKLVRFITGMGDDDVITISRVRHRRAVSNNEPRASHISSRSPVVQPLFRSRDTLQGKSYRPYRESDVQASSQLRVPQPSTPVPRPRTSSQSLSPSPGRFHRPSLQGSPASTQSHTDSLLSWIPNTLSPRTTSALLKELSEPISDADEPGYIYMCWVTPQMQTASPPPAELASSLIPTSSDSGVRRKQRTSDIMRSAGIAPNKVHDPQLNDATDTIILKIGRSANVHRRMNQWKDQCAHNLTLMRYYPHVPSSSSVHPGAPIPPRKVPHTHRVERLVHLELADRSVKLQGPCRCCGRKHKEWFEIRAEREQLKIVDECVQRWVRWSEMTGR
ncbi:hypothetical protein AJ78_04523 [Emergomyces pasteurianus Ep9510]|uniref:Bacteriophage T5 Orf172 DNA-binding domain-containing protein n=1 Tax=Emergomyces pasteurianus Ep9510 TaxID=1447872 RepID=A0A1J9PFG5_9EURO|nr:hypothetical protein AJ78_04523 [Emergomyces pasteurianus Ep9510]